MVNPRRALITGVTGQDGSYLAELLLRKGYQVYGATRHPNHAVTSRLSRIADELTTVGGGFEIVRGDLRDSSWIVDLLRDIAPTEIYNLAAQSNVALSFSEPELTHEVNYVAVSALLDALER
jgi:GDPmannose 4,6-dehydratase